MFTIGYYKLGGKWFLDLPDDLAYDDDDLEKIGGFYDFLEIVSEGKSFIRFQMDLEPFDGSDEMTFTGSSGGNSGGYYHIQSLNGRNIDLEIWYGTHSSCPSASLPAKLYIKQVN